MAGYANPYAVNWPLQDDSPPQTATTYYENYSRNNSVSRPSIGAYYPPGRAIVRSGTDRSASSGGTTDSEKSRSNARYGGRPFDDEKKSSAGNGTANAADTTVWLDEKIRSPLTTSSGERIELHRNDAATSQVVGTTQLYDQGRLRLIPMPTPDPKGTSNIVGRQRQGAAVPGHRPVPCLTGYAANMLPVAAE